MTLLRVQVLSGSHFPFSILQISVLFTPLGSLPYGALILPMGDPPFWNYSGQLPWEKWNCGQHECKGVSHPPCYRRWLAVSQGAEGIVLPLNEVKFHLGCEATGMVSW